MREYMDDIVWLEHILHRIWYIAFEYDKGYSDTVERWAEIMEWVFYELPMKIRKIRSTRNSGLKTIKSDDWYRFLSPDSYSLTEGQMIADTEIPLIPDEDDFFFFWHIYFFVRYLIHSYALWSLSMKNNLTDCLRTLCSQNTSIPEVTIMSHPAGIGVRSQTIPKRKRNTEKNILIQRGSIMIRWYHGWIRTRWKISRNFSL